MARFFVSYSRSVKSEVRKVIDLLIASGHEVWWDGDIPVMADWWATILDKIEWCDVFIFVASEKSVQSAYCLAELKYASDRQRPILPFMLEDPTALSLPPALPSRGQWLLYDGEPARMLTKINDAYQNINWDLHRDIRVRRPPEPLTGGQSLAKQFQEARRLANEKHFEEAKARLINIKRLDYGEWGTECDEWLARINSYVPIIELADDESTFSRARTEWAMHTRQYGDDFDPYDIAGKLRNTITIKTQLRRIPIVGGIAFIAMLILVGVLVLSSNGGNDEDTPQETVNITDTPNPQEQETAIAQAEIELTDLAATETSTETPTPSPSATTSPTATASLTAAPQLRPVDATITAVMREFEAATATQAAFLAPTQTQQMTETMIAVATATQAERQARQTGTQQAVETEVFEQLATLVTWTPTATATPTLTVTATETLTPTPTNTATLTPRPDPEQIAQEGVTSNAEWETLVGEDGYVREFDGVEMVLVPAGSFEMGSTDAEIDLAVELCNAARQDGETCPESFFTDETPTSTQDFTSPFWIDRTEVTRAQYQVCVDTGVCDETPDSDFSSEPNQPINRVTWFQAQSYCEWRGDSARLPTEAEWEYAARGPDRLLFPWGNEFDGSLANHCDSNCADADWASGFTYVNEENDDGFVVAAPVASYPAGASWVGAHDMSGNVWEWTSTIYDQDDFPYPYDEADGREDVDNRSSVRVVRGGSFSSSSGGLRAASRVRVDPFNVSGLVGFRCVRPPSL